MKRIAVMTSGGDAPGMNAAIRAVVRAAIDKEMEVFGVVKGYAGLIENNIIPLNLRSVSDIIHRGGTILRTARCPEFKEEKGQKIAIKNLQTAGIEGLVVIGGDGSFAGARVLTEKGFPTVGIPGTIDNDLAYTDFTLGFDTACNTVLDAINKIRDTMSSHERISVVQVMGRRCGDLALYAGIGGGAEIIVVPEIPMTPGKIAKKLDQFKKSGKYSGIIVLAEGAGHADELCEILSKKTKLHIRSTVLGHIQRGGSPSMRDRLLGTSFGAAAVNLLHKGVGGRLVGTKNNKVFDIDIIDGLNKTKKFDKKLYDLAAIVAK